eukprot:470219_1
MSAQVMTSQEGELEFNFETWIRKSNLTEIKDLFIKHKVTKQATLQLGSPQFMALMSDPELLTNKSSMIPRIIQALQSVNAPIEANPRSRVVITETEETAMDNAESECGKTLKDIDALTTAIENTNKNYTQCQEQINTMFDEFAKDLRKRQKQLLIQLDEVKQRKINAFQTQLDDLKGFRKQYNDTKHQWDNILYHQNMDKAQRKQTITETAKTLTQNSADMKDTNKAVLSLVTDHFDVKMKSYQSYVDTYGQVGGDKCFTKPTISEWEAGCRTVKFTVECGSDHSDEKTEQNARRYEVQWKPSDGHEANDRDSDEKCEWNIKDFVSNRIELKDLSANTIYGVRCRIKYGKVCSPFCNVYSFTTRKATEIFEIKRGSIGVYNWYYDDGSIAALCFTSDKNITLYGIGVFDAKGTINVKYEIIKGDNDNYDKTDIIAASQQKSFTRESRTKIPIRFDLPSPIHIQQNTKYTIQLTQKNNNRAYSYRVTKGQGTVTMNGVTITFKNAKKSPNGTDSTYGAFPILYCSL